MIGLLPIFAMPKSRYANTIWLSIGLCLKTGYFDPNYGKLIYWLTKIKSCQNVGKIFRYLFGLVPTNNLFSYKVSEVSSNLPKFWLQWSISKHESNDSQSFLACFDFGMAKIGSKPSRPLITWWLTSAIASGTIHVLYDIYGLTVQSIEIYTVKLQCSWAVVLFSHAKPASASSTFLSQ